MTSLSVASRSDRWSAAADWLAAGVLLTLPWSTSATSILIVVWLIAVFPRLDRQELSSILAEPAAFLPVLLWSLACVGMLWAETSWAERLEGLRGFHKLLLIPLLMIHFSRSDNGLKVISAFLFSSLFLLVYSWASLVWPGFVWSNQYRVPGVPIKDSIYLSICFAISACVLLHLAMTLREKGQYWQTATCLIIALMFLANLAFVANSRTAVVIVAVLFPLVGYQRRGWRGAAALLIVTMLLGAAAWSMSEYFRVRVSSIVEQTLQYTPTQNSSEAERIEFWRKSLHLMEEAPAIGLGTGSIRREFEKSKQGTQGAAAVVVANPHNQFFAIGLQLGTVGVTVLWLMWIAHLLLFRGHGLVPWLGTLLVVENISAAPFNSHLSDFTAGWLYVMGVGILGGMMLRQRRSADACDVKISAHYHPSVACGR